MLKSTDATSIGRHRSIDQYRSSKAGFFKSSGCGLLTSDSTARSQANSILTYVQYIKFLIFIIVVSLNLRAGGDWDWDWGFEMGWMDAWNE